MIYTERLARLSRRRQRLVEECARHRERVVAELEAWHMPLKAVDRGLAATRFLRAHPVAVAALVASAAVLGRRHLAPWAARGILIWRGWRSLQAIVGVLRGQAS